MSYTISNPAVIIAVLLAVELGMMTLAGSKRFGFLFKFLPAVFWIYFLPMVLSTAENCRPVQRKSFPGSRRKSFLQRYLCYFWRWI